MNAFNTSECNLQHGQIIDAVRVQDGVSVALKKISKSVHPYEADIGKFFSTEPLASDPRNKCIPILGTLQPPDDEDVLILVMPLLRRYDSPRFDTFGEAIHFFAQIFTVCQSKRASPFALVLTFYVGTTIYA